MSRFPPRPPVQGPEVVPLVTPSMPGATRLVTRPDQVQVFSAVRLTDARTAVARGLAEYLGSLRARGSAGRDVSLDAVLETWATPEEHATYPAAVVLGAGPGAYDASRFANTVEAGLKLGETGPWLVSWAEYRQLLSVEIWATSAQERVAVIAMVEDGMNPVDWMGGVRLELPHYFGERADYQLVQVEYLDSEADAIQGYRRAALRVQAVMPVTRALSFPQAVVRGTLAVDGGPDETC